MNRKLSDLADKVQLVATQDDLAKPEGFFDLEELRRWWKYQTTSAASSRAKMLTIEGMMERKAYKTGGSTGRHFWAYAYKPARGFRSLKQVDEAARTRGGDAVPKGWFPATEFCKRHRVSVQAIMQMCHRHRIPARVFRVPRGINQMKPVFHYSEKQLLKHYAKHRRKAAG